MLSRVQRTIAARRLVTPGAHVLVGVSGGPDSTALLHALRILAPRLGIALRAAVVDHGLREGSAQEAAAVAAACAGLGIASTTLSVAVSREPGVSVQEAARRVRLAALAAEAERSGCQHVALGHTADDQAETLLFRIVRGTGVHGLRGIPYQRPPFIRPLLDVRRAEVLAFLRRRRVSWVEDPSNDQPRYTRARVRHGWLPFLQRENPRVVDALLALAADARGEPPPAPRTRRRSPTGATPEKPAARLKVAASGAEGSGVVPVAIAAAGAYRLSSAEQASLVRLTIEAVGGSDAVAGSADGFDADAIAWPLLLRTRRPGDRMRPRGGAGTRKLQDLMVDAKIPRVSRDTLPVLTDADGTVLWVAHLRPAAHARPGRETRRVMRVTWPDGNAIEDPPSPSRPFVDQTPTADNTFSQPLERTKSAPKS